MMTRMAVLLIVLMAATTYGAETKQVGIWASLAEKLEKAPRKKPIITTAVGGVRGKKNDAQDLYWKGKQRSELEQDEAGSFHEALSTAVSGDKEGALRRFESFISQYPNSLLREDAVKAVAELKKQPEVSELPATEPVKEEVKTDPAPAPKEDASQAEEKPAPVESKEGK